MPPAQPSRDELSCCGRELRERLELSDAVHVSPTAGYDALSLETQVIKFALSAERKDLERSETAEVIMQVAPYCGFSRSLNALALLDQN